ncbi:NlpC/P60 family protein [Streptomyces sp. NPDC018019]|uniref:C40 family peptidase n=1 Tax=Streptomyces sp. NPDC018019 TaxID=3365030 RepID=UPI0037A5897F
MKAVKGCALAVLALVLGLLMLVVSVVADNDAQAAPDTGGGGLRGVPEEFRRWILQADRECDAPELTPALLAAQLKQESGFRTGNVRSPVGAQGPAQFMPGTWATWGRDADGNGRSDPTDTGDAVVAQGRMMCSLIKQAKASGITGDPRALALAGYNAGWGAVTQHHGIPPYRETRDYVRLIMTSMKQFEGLDTTLQIRGSGAGPDALRKASGRLGTPYSYGGGGPAGPSTGFCDDGNGYLGGRCAAATTVGFDCSSLVQYAYWEYRKLPRTAAAQYNATSDRPVARADLKPGDLLFWRKRGKIYHVALYAGDGKVLQAPRTGRNIEVAPMTTAMPASDYAGATRP